MIGIFCVPVVIKNDDVSNWKIIENIICLLTTVDVEDIEHLNNRNSEIVN